MNRLSGKSLMMILAGLLIGVLAALMVRWGNPPNMGLCVACFLRDITGALGLHRAEVVQYLRPEIMGIVLGALAAALLFREFRSRGGSSPILRFMLGAFVMIGALVFLGCPIRALLRLAGGDLNGITALAGVVAGAAVGIVFLRSGFNLGRAGKVNDVSGLTMPAIMLGLLVLAIIGPAFIFSSASGPGSMHASFGIAIGLGLLVGVLAQRLRMCFVGGWRDLIMVRDTYLFGGIAAFFIGALIVNFALGNVQWGFAGQPVAHSNHLWNFMSMGLVGLGATLLGGCPIRQLVLAGEGDADAAATILGLIAGAAIAHNFLISSSPQGVGQNGVAAVVIGLVFTLGIGFFMSNMAAGARRYLWRLTGAAKLPSRVGD